MKIKSFKVNPTRIVDNKFTDDDDPVSENINDQLKELNISSEDIKGITWHNSSNQYRVFYIDRNIEEPVYVDVPTRS